MKGFRIKYWSFIIVVCIGQSLFAQQSYPTMGCLESKSAKFDELIPKNAKFEILSDGYIWTEGPVWVPQLNGLLFSDIPTNTVYKWTEKKGIEVFLKPSGYTGSLPKGEGANGLTLDNNGELILCQTGDRQLARLSKGMENPQPIYTVIADKYNGVKLNTTNDVVVDSKGNIYFTDPIFGKKPKERELGYQGVFKVGLDGQVTLVSKTWTTPNGIGLSPDETTLYVAYSAPNKLTAIDITKEGTFINERILFDTQEIWEQSVAKQKPDGMDVHSDGTIFMTGPDGVLIFSPKGEHLGTIKTDTRTANCTFNEDESVLYVTAHHKLLRIVLK